MPFAAYWRCHCSAAHATTVNPRANCSSKWLSRQPANSGAHIETTNAGSEPSLDHLRHLIFGVATSKCGPLAPQLGWMTMLSSNGNSSNSTGQHDITAQKPSVSL